MNGEATGARPVTGEARWASAYRIGTQLLAAAIVLQFLLAGMGIFGSGQFMFLHAVVNAALIFFGSLIVLACGWRAGAGRANLRLVGAIPALVILQSILLVPYHMGAPAPL